MSQSRAGVRSPRVTVRARILAAILLVATVGLGVVGGVSYLIQRQQALADVDERLLEKVEAARLAIDADAGATDQAGGRIVEPRRVEDVEQALAVILALVVPPPSGSALGIVEGQPAFLPGVAVPFTLDGAAGLIARVDRETTDGTVRIGTSLDGDRPLRYVAAPVVVDGDDRRGVFLVAIDLDAALAPLHRTFAVFAVVGGLTVLAIGLAGWVVAGRLLRPIRILRETAERITARDSSERIPVEGRDDVSRLTATVNDMLDRLSDGLTNQRELLADVRHELKTPITVVSGHLELVDPSDPADVTQVRSLAISELHRMSGLLDDLTTWAEVRMAVVDPFRFDIAELTRDVAALSGAIPGHSWVVAETASGTMVADRPRIVQAWLQLADNAAKHSPVGSTVELGSTRVDGQVELWVRDYGPGVPQEIGDRIFDRFVRARTGARGSGLGLAIVAGIARAHGGAARLDRLPDGSRFSIVLPADFAVGIPTAREAT